MEAVRAILKNTPNFDHVAGHSSLFNEAIRDSNTSLLTVISSIPSLTTLKRPLIPRAFACLSQIVSSKNQSMSQL